VQFERSARFSKIKGCRLCESKNLQTVLSFGKVPLANSFKKHPCSITAPLEVALCTDCGCVQLLHTVNPKSLFSNYQYASSTSVSFRNHFAEYAKSLAVRYQLNSLSIVYELGSNDGILQSPFRDLGVRVIGVEPAKNIHALAVEKGFTSINDFFTPELALKLKKIYGPAKLIIANNVFAHLPDFKGFALGVKSLLEDGGDFVIENAYWLKNFENRDFPQIYSEHTVYQSIAPLYLFFKELGMSLYDVDFNEIQCGSFRAYIKKSVSEPNRPCVTKAIINESANELFNPESYSRFLSDITDLKSEVRTLLNNLKNEGKTIGIYGCPAKLTLLLHFFGVKDVFSYAIGESPLKVECYVPGTQIKVFPPQKFKDEPCDFMFLGAYNFADSIIKRNVEYKGKWIIPFPKLKIV